MEKIACGGFMLGENLTQTVNDDGMPVLNAQGGGGGGFVDAYWHFYFDPNEHYDISHTPEQVKQLLEEGKTVFFRWKDDETMDDYKLKCTINYERDKILCYNFAHPYGADDPTEYKIWVAVIGDISTGRWNLTENL